MDPNAITPSGNDVYELLRPHAAENEGDLKAKRQKLPEHLSDLMDEGEKTFNLSQESVDAPSSASSSITDDQQVEYIAALLKEIPLLPGAARRPDEYILVVGTGSGRVTGTVKGKLGRLPTRDEFNNACRLYRDGAGNYFPPPQAYNRILVPDEIEDKAAFRKDVWYKAHREMNISGTRMYFDLDPKYPLDKYGKLRPEDQYTETAYGRRKVQRHYLHSFQAGMLLPDIMIKTPDNDVYFVSRSENDRYTNKTFQEFEAIIKRTYGSESEIKLKSESGIMHDSKYLDAWQQGSADIRFASYAGEVRTHNPDLPHAIVNLKSDVRPQDVFLSVEAVFQSPGNPWAEALKRGELWDRILIRDRTGNTYKTPQRLMYSDRDHFKKILDRVGLPHGIGEFTEATATKYERFQTQAAVLVADGAIIKDIRSLSAEERTQAVTAHVLLADRNSQNQRKGTYTSLLEYARTKEQLPHDVADLLGHPIDYFSHDRVQPAPERPPIVYSGDPRTFVRVRDQTVNNL
uniref:VirE2 n=1 Tax=Agrobacterium tumefaciens TaxID=358 RepID=Q8VT82_AGRTU|nr:VirE2 [Agrobacterium tumefaciens]